MFGCLGKARKFVCKWHFETWMEKLMVMYGWYTFTAAVRGQVYTYFMCIRSLFGWVPPGPSFGCLQLLVLSAYFAITLHWFWQLLFFDVHLFIFRCDFGRLRFGRYFFRFFSFTPVARWWRVLCLFRIVRLALLSYSGRWFSMKRANTHICFWCAPVYWNEHKPAHNACWCNNAYIQCLVALVRPGNCM